MGLDITAYSKLNHIGRHSADWCENDDHVVAYTYANFPESFRGIPALADRYAGGTDFIEGGCYVLTDETQTHGFRAGSYSGYGHWRADLQRQFNPTLTPDGPFYELIWFADNEGCIGPDAAKDLLADFREHADRYEGEDYAHHKYEDWTRACELAADGGLIRFH